MKVAEVMNKNVVTCHPLEKLSVIVNKLELFHIAGMPVMEKSIIVGVVIPDGYPEGAQIGRYPAGHFGGGRYDERDRYRGLDGARRQRRENHDRQGHKPGAGRR